MKQVENYLQNGEVYVWKETFAIAKARGPVQNVFASVYDKNENTVVLDQLRLEENKENLQDTDTDWRIITFDLLLPLDMVGFIAAISSALAQAKVSILWISAYSTDHMLVKNRDLPKALQTLQSLGCKIKEK